MIAIYGFLVLDSVLINISWVGPDRVHQGHMMLQFFFNLYVGI